MFSSSNSGSDTYIQLAELHDDVAVVAVVEESLELHDIHMPQRLVQGDFSW